MEKRAFILVKLRDKHLKAFTLIELLVVIAIIGILATLSVYTFNGAKEKGRDATRKADLQAIKSSLVVYFYEQKPNIYHIPTANPVNLSSEADARTATGLTIDYLKSFPLEMKYNTTYPYVYQTSTDGKDYALYAQLETEGDSDIKTSDPVAGAKPASYDKCYWLEND